MLVIFVCASPALAADCTDDTLEFPSPPGPPTHTARFSGRWNEPGIWIEGSTPGDGAIVCIPFGKAVNVTRRETARIRFIRVEGELHMWPEANTRLWVDTLYVAPNGHFMIGDPARPVQPQFNAEVVFISTVPIDLSWDKKQESRGLISDGFVGLYGIAKTHMVRMKQNARKYDTALNLGGTVPADWKANDEIVLTGTHFRRNTDSQDERVLITSTSATTIEINAELKYEHTLAREDLDLNLHVANLTRNVILSSEKKTPTIPVPPKDRGHVMFRGGSADLRYVRFTDLGRTDKRIPLDDFIVDLDTGDVSPRPPSQIGNRRGRYAVHFHQLGILLTVDQTPPNNVIGCVVTGTPGWGFVNHTSHVDFRNNVVWDFAGAAFVTEAGDELGNFFDNIAIRGKGNGEYDKARINFENRKRPQPLGDFAFRGDGFWFQGPALHARNNVANGCHGAGIIWHTTGGIDTNINRYVGFPRSALSAVYDSFAGFMSFEPRYWSYSDTNEKIVVADLPIREFDGFDAYANFIGVHLRFNNHNAVDWYTEKQYNYDAFIVPVSKDNPNADPKLVPHRMNQSVKNLNLWNNEQGFRARYNSHTDWRNIKNINRLDYDDTSAYSGAEFDFVVRASTFGDLIIDGYEVAGKFEDCGNNADKDIDLFDNISNTYLNYANYNTWNTNPCSAPTSCLEPKEPRDAFVSSTSRAISWAAGDTATQRYLVRYRADGNQQWQFKNTTSTSVTLSGLETGKTYTYQVIAGCAKVVNGKLTETAPSHYTARKTFNTSLPVFADVPLNHWARKFIESIYLQGVTVGCATNPLRFCPDAQLTRAEVAPFLLRSKLGANYVPPPASCAPLRFADVPCNHWAAAWIEELARRGITGGCGSGNYCPDGLVDRSQAAVFLLVTRMGAGYVPPSVNCNAPRFSDVPCTHWAAAWIEELARRGITGGCGSGNYCPAGIVNRAMMAVFLVQTFNFPTAP